MEWSCPASRIFLISSFFFATSYGDFPSGATQAVRCILSISVPQDCTTHPEVIVPSYLVSAYNNSPQSLHDALRSGRLNSLSYNQLASLPLSLLYLIPRGRLTDLNGTQLGAVIKKYGNDTCLAHQVAACLQNQLQLVQLIHKLNNTRQEVLQILGESINPSLLDENFFRTLSRLQEPILAYLRPEVLSKVDPKIFSKILSHVRDSNPTNPPRKEAMHVITQAALKRNYTLAELSINRLLLGLTPDQLRDESILKDFNLVKNFKLNFTSMQARAVFDYVYRYTILNQTHVIDCQPLLTKLSPSLLLKFPTKELSYDTLTKLHGPLSLPTACQIREYLMANCRMTGKLPKEDEPWGIQVRYLHHWVYTLPLSALDEYIDSPLSTAYLNLLQSPALSPLQAYYLTGKGKSLDVEVPNSIQEQLGPVLQALPASQLVNRKVGDISSLILKHLVATLPGDNLPRTLALVHKIASSIGEWFMLESLLMNKDANAIMSLVSPKDLDAAASKMLKTFSWHPDHKPKLRQFPQPVLAALLERARQTKDWSWQSMLDSSQISHFLVGALTCQHIEAMDIGLFIPIFSLYNRHRQQAFPKNLQQCSLKKLINHLKLKMTLSQTDASNGLISLLEPIEIASVGGYVLVGLPVEAMKKSPYLGQILSTIGKLSNAELMFATNRSRLQAIADLAIDKDGKVDSFVIGNLIWFLPQNTVVPELKLMLEAGVLDTTLCMPVAERRALARKLITAFGLPESWSGGVLATLQDLLLVFSDEELRNVSQVAWTEVADSFQSHYGDDVHWINTTSFYQVCANILGKNTLEEFEYISAVTSLVRWRLRAAQWQLNTVKQNLSYTSTTFYPVDEEDTEQEHKITVSVFDPEVIEEPAGQSNEEDESVEDDSEEEIMYDSKEYEDESVDEETTEKASATIKIESETTVKVPSTEKVTTMEPLKSSTVVSILPVSSPSTTTKKVTTVVQVAEPTTTTLKPVDYTGLSSKIPQTFDEAHSTTEKPVTKNVSVKVEVDKKETESMKETESKSSIEPSSKENESIPRIKSSTTKTFSNKSVSEETTIATSTPKNVQTNKDIKGAEEGSHPSTVITVSPINESNSSPHHSSSSDSQMVVEPKNTDENQHTTNNQPSTQQAEEIVHKNDLNKEFSNAKANETNGGYEDKNENGEKNIDKNEENFNTINNIEEEKNKQNKIEENENEVEEIEENNNEVYNGERDESEEEPYKDEIKPVDKTEGNNSEVHNNDMDETDKNMEDEDDADDSTEKEEYEDITDGPSIIDSEHSSRRKRSSDGSDQPEYNVELTCNALRMVGKIAALALSDRDLETMADAEVIDCRVELGAMELSDKQQQRIWKQLKKNKLNGFHLLGNLLRASVVADLWDVDFDISQPWALETVHAFMRLSNKPVGVGKMMKRVEKANKDYSPELLAVMGGSVCDVEQKQLRSLSVVGLAPWTHCPPCLPWLAQAAVDQLGKVSLWTQHHMHVLHSIVAGLNLEDWKKLAESEYKPLSALQPSAVWCLNNSHLEILSPEQIRQIPTLSLLSLSQQQTLALNETQLWALGNATQLSVPEKLTSNKKIIYVAGVTSAGSSLDDSSGYVVFFLFVAVIFFGICGCCCFCSSCGCDDFCNIC